MAKATTRKVGTQTKPQGLNGIGAEASAMIGMLFRGSVPAGSYQTYRDMLEDPTIALSHAATTAPIIAAGWSIEADDDAPEGAKELIEDVFEPLRGRLMYQACRAIYYGWQSFEKVWGIDDMGRMVIERFKPLIPDYTEVAIDRDTGQVVGVKQGGVVLDRGHSVIISNDSEGENPYGRSRLENLRRWAWRPWTQGMEKLAQYQAKTAGVVPVIRYPEGEGKNASGQTVRNYEAATQMNLQLGLAHGIVMPTAIPDWAMDALRSGQNISDLMAWSVSFLETRAGHGAEFITSLSYQDKLKVRGYLLPERTILEGQFGTKAEAGVHGDIAVLISQQFLDCVVEELNRQAVDDVLVVNFGKSVRGKVYLTPGPIQDSAKALYQTIVSALYGGNPDLALEQLDMDAMLDSLRLPKASEDIDEVDPMDVAPVGGTIMVPNESNPANTDDRATLDRIMDGASKFVPSPEEPQPAPRFSRTIENAVKQRAKRAKYPGRTTPSRNARR